MLLSLIILTATGAAPAPPAEMRLHGELTAQYDKLVELRDSTNRVLSNTTALVEQMEGARQPFVAKLPVILDGVRTADRAGEEAHKIRRRFDRLFAQRSKARHWEVTRGLFENEWREGFGQGRVRQTARFYVVFYFVRHRWGWEPREGTCFNYRCFSTAAAHVGMADEHGKLMHALAWAGLYCTDCYPAALPAFAGMFTLGASLAPAASR
jgi:hypothetical protein